MCLSFNLMQSSKTLMSRGSEGVTSANPIRKRAEGTASKQAYPTSGSYRGDLAYILDCTQGILLSI